MMAVPNWVRPTDALGAIQAGANAGIAVREANRREAQLAQDAQLAMLDQQRKQQDAEQDLAYRYDALTQARLLAQIDDALKREAFEENKKNSAADILLKQHDSDALSKYREGVLKNQAERNTKIGIGKPFVPQFHNVGGVPILETAPGVVQVANIPGFVRSADVPLITDVPLDPKKPYGVKMNARANNPILNQLMGTNAVSGIIGTNWDRSMPTLRSQPAAIAPAPASPAPVVAPAPIAPASAVGAEDLTREEPVVEKKKLDRDTAAKFVEAAGGDKNKARELARAAGYTF